MTCFVTGESKEATARARTDCTLYFFSGLIKGTIANQHPTALENNARPRPIKSKCTACCSRTSLNNDNFIRVCKMLVYLVQSKNVDIPAGQKRVVIQPGIHSN